MGTNFRQFVVKLQSQFLVTEALLCRGRLLSLLILFSSLVLASFLLNSRDGKLSGGRPISVKHLFWIRFTSSFNYEGIPSHRGAPYSKMGLIRVV